MNRTEGFGPLALQVMAYYYFKDLDDPNSEACLKRLENSIEECCGDPDNPNETFTQKLKAAHSVVEDGGIGSPQYEAAQIARKASQLKNSKDPEGNRLALLDEINDYRGRFKFVLRQTFGQNVTPSSNAALKLNATELLEELTSKIGGKKRKRLGKDDTSIPVLKEWALSVLKPDVWRSAGKQPYGDGWTAETVLDKLAVDQQRMQKARMPATVVAAIKAKIEQMVNSNPANDNLQQQLNVILKLVDPEAEPITAEEDETLKAVQEEMAKKARQAQVIPPQEAVIEGVAIEELVSDQSPADADLWAQQIATRLGMTLSPDVTAALKEAILAEYAGNLVMNVGEEQRFLHIADMNWANLFDLISDLRTMDQLHNPDSTTLDQLAAEAAVRSSIESLRERVKDRVGLSWSAADDQILDQKIIQFLQANPDFTFDTDAGFIQFGLQLGNMSPAQPVLVQAYQVLIPASPQQLSVPLSPVSEGIEFVPIDEALAGSPVSEGITVIPAEEAFAISPTQTSAPLSEGITVIPADEAFGDILFQGSDIPSTEFFADDVLFNPGQTDSLQRQQQYDRAKTAVLSDTVQVYNTSVVANTLEKRILLPLMEKYINDYFGKEYWASLSEDDQKALISDYVESMIVAVDPIRRLQEEDDIRDLGPDADLVQAYLEKFGAGDKWDELLEATEPQGALGAKLILRGHDFEVDVDFLSLNYEGLLPFNSSHTASNVLGALKLRYTIADSNDLDRAPLCTAFKMETSERNRLFCFGIAALGPYQIIENSVSMAQEWAEFKKSWKKSNPNKLGLTNTLSDICSKKDLIDVSQLSKYIDKTAENTRFYVLFERYRQQMTANTFSPNSEFAFLSARETRWKINSVNKDVSIIESFCHTQPKLPPSTTYFMLLVLYHILSTYNQIDTYVIRLGIQRLPEGKTAVSAKKVALLHRYFGFERANGTTYERLRNSGEPAYSALFSPTKQPDQLNANLSDEYAYMWRKAFTAQEVDLIAAEVFLYISGIRIKEFTEI